MNPDVKTDKEDHNVMNACKIMHDNNIGCVIVVGLEEIKKPVGIITERDVVRILGRLDPTLHKKPLSNLMTKPLITINEVSSVKDAMELMNGKNIRRLVVVNKDHQMVGIITLKDIFQLINTLLRCSQNFMEQVSLPNSKICIKDLVNTNLTG